MTMTLIPAVAGGEMPRLAGAASLILERQFSASPERVFDAWGTAAAMKHWFAPGPDMTAEADLDFRPGGRFRIVMHGGEESYEHVGEYLAVERPRRLVFTWISPATGGKPSLVTLELSPADGGTRLVLRHEALPPGEVVERHRGGWTAILEKLAAKLAA